MPKKDHAMKPNTQVRYAKRAVHDEQWIVAFLQRAAIGTLATVYNGRPFINMNLFVYDAAKHCIYMHTANSGRTLSNVEQEQTVCFSINEMGRLLPAEEALEFSVEYAGVVVFGRASIISDPAEQEHGLQILLDKYFPHLKPSKHYRPIMPEELKRTAVYRIDIDEWSGKQKQVADDFPGAFFYGNPPSNT